MVAITESDVRDRATEYMERIQKVHNGWMEETKTKGVDKHLVRFAMHVVYGILWKEFHAGDATDRTGLATLDRIIAETESITGGAPQGRA